MINKSFVIKKTIQFEHSIEYIIPSLSPEKIITHPSKIKSKKNLTRIINYSTAPAESATERKFKATSTWVTS